jgi:FSR family fosmidomycin resistance protein-like MFS transporter
MRSISTAAEITFQYRKIMIISGGHFFHDVFSSFLAVFLPLLISKFSLSMALAGMFTVVFRAPNLMNPLLGILSDRMNLNRLAIWAPAITAVAMSLLGLAPSYGVVCILLLLAGTVE